MKKIFLLLAIMFSMVAYAENDTFIIDEKLPNLDKAATNNETRSNSSYWGPYMRDLQQRVKRNWILPKEVSQKHIVATVNFTVDRSGRLLDCKITKSSGIPEADKAVKDAIEKTAPFRPLPKEFKGYSTPIEFTFDNTQY